MEHSCFWHTRSMDDTCCINPNDEQSIVTPKNLAIYTEMLLILTCHQQVLWIMKV